MHDEGRQGIEGRQGGPGRQGRQAVLKRRVAGTGLAFVGGASAVQSLQGGGPQTEGEWAVFGAEVLFTLLSMIFGWRRG